VHYCDICGEEIADPEVFVDEDGRELCDECRVENEEEEEEE
jgi:hypothetical protein